MKICPKNNVNISTTLIWIRSGLYTITLRTILKSKYEGVGVKIVNKIFIEKVHSQNLILLVEMQ